MTRLRLTEKDTQLYTHIYINAYAKHTHTKREKDKQTEIEADTETDRQTGREGKEETKEEGGEGWGRGIKVRKPYPNAQNQRSKWDLNLGLCPFFLLILYTTLSSTRIIPPPLEKCPSPGPPLCPVRAQP